MEETVVWARRAGAECRNGGHPDWVLDNCGKLRSSDPKYLSCVSGWYTALSAELKGLFHKDGGPVTLVQVRYFHFLHLAQY